MNTNSIVFENYRKEFVTILPESLATRWIGIRSNVRSGIDNIKKTVPLPDLIVKVTDLGVTILSFFPKIDPFLGNPKQWCKDAKTFMNFFKSTECIDGFLNEKISLRMLILNVSSLAFFTFSSMTIVDRLGLFHATNIKNTLARIPIIGILPYGGLLPIAIFGVLTSVIMMNVEKRKKLKQEANHIEEKINCYWAIPLDLGKVKAKEVKYQTKLNQLDQQKKVFENVLVEGKKIKAGLNSLDKKMNSCQKAIQELEDSQKKKEDEIKKYSDKYSAWQYLESHWDSIDKAKLEQFREAKLKKWKVKLEKNEYENRTTFNSYFTNGTVLSKQIFKLGAALCGYGLFFPLLLNFGLDFVATVGSFDTFLTKRRMKKLNPHQPVQLSSYSL